MQKLLIALTNDPEFQAILLKEFRDAKGSNFVKAGQDALVIANRKEEFQRAIHKAFQNKQIMARVGKEDSFGEVLTPSVQNQVGPTVKLGVKDMFSNYNFEATRWDELARG